MRDTHAERSIAMPPIKQAEQLNRERRLDEAVLVLERAAQEHPDNVMLLAELGKYLRYTMRADESARHLHHALELAPDDREVLFQLGRTLAFDAHLWEALEIHIRLLQQHPDDAGLRVELAEDEIMMGAPEKAIPHLTEMVAAQPDALEVRRTLAYALNKAGRYTEAIAHVESILKVVPDYFLGWAALAEAYWGLVRIAEWQEAAERACKISSRGPVSQRLRGDLLFQLGRFEEAAACYESALAIHPRHYRAHVALGNLHSNAGQSAIAERHFQAALMIAPWDGSVQGNWAQFQEQTGHPLDLEKLSAAAREVPRSRLSLWLAQIYAHLRNDPQRAIEWLRFTVDHLPEEVQAYAELSRLYLQQNDVDSALQTAERLVTLSPRHGGGWYSLAHAAAHKADVDRAVVAFAHAVELHSQEANVHQGYGMTLLALGRAEEAKRALQRALELDPENATCALGLALALEATGSASEAREWGERARAGLPPGHPELAELLVRLGSAS